MSSLPIGYFQDVTIDMLDYEYLDKCKDTDLIKAIVRKLKSGEEGHYPHLVKVRVHRQALRIFGVRILTTAIFPTM